MGRLGAHAPRGVGSRDSLLLGLRATHCVRSDVARTPYPRRSRWLRLSACDLRRFSLSLTRRRHGSLTAGVEKREFYASAFRRKLYHSLDELKRDAHSWMETYNGDRRIRASPAASRRHCRPSSRARSSRTINNWIGSSQHPKPLQHRRNRRVYQIKSRLGHNNETRPHMAINDLAPEEYARQSVALNAEN